MATQAQLDEAKAAYHDLLTGQQVVSVTIDGVQTQYSQADRKALSQYIATLESDLGVTAPRRRPARIYT